MTSNYMIIFYFLGVWIDYMRFEQEYGNKKLRSKICCTATFKLRRELFRSFMDQQLSLEREFWLVL